MNDSKVIITFEPKRSNQDETEFRTMNRELKMTTRPGQQFKMFMRVRKFTQTRESLS